MLMSFKVEKLVIAAIPNLVETWTEGFGFKPLEDSEKKNLNKINLMVFPGTVLLKKPLYEIQKADRRTGECCLVSVYDSIFMLAFKFSQSLIQFLDDKGPGDESPSRADESTKVDTCSQREPMEESLQKSGGNSCSKKVGAKSIIEPVEGENLQEFETESELAVIDGDMGQVDASSIGGEESTFHSGGEVKIKSVQQDGYFSANQVVTETETGRVEGNDLQELKVDAEMETRLVDANLQESEDGAKMEVIQSNGNCCTNEVDAQLDIKHTEGKKMEVGESQVHTLQDQFSELSCVEWVPTLGDSQPKIVAGNEFYGLYDERPLSLDEQPQKACELNEK
jgi:hypothetical protein